MLNIFNAKKVLFTKKFTPLKLLSVIITMNPLSGGPAQGIRNNIPYWEQQGIYPTILTFDDPNSVFPNQEHITAIGPSKNSWAFAERASRWLLDNLHNFDAVLIHGLWLYNGYVVTKSIKQLKQAGKRVPKVFVIPHGMLDPYFQNAPERKFKALRNSLYWHLVEKYTINNADGVLFTCAEEMDLAQTTFKGYSPKATYNIGYGIISPPIFVDTHLNAFYDICPQVSNKPYFIFLSRIHHKKGTDILIHAYARCYDYCLNIGIELPELVIAGPGMDTEYGKSLQMIHQSYKILKNKIHYSGMLQGDSKWGALYGAELFVLPSHQENFGIAIVEALACKTPVLISNKVNIWREIENGGGGIICEDNLNSIFDGFKLWVHKKQLDRDIMKQSAYKTFVSEFSIEQTSRNLVKLI